MVKVVGIRFRNAGKIYYFGPGDLDLKAAIKASSLSDEIVNREIANGF